MLDETLPRTGDDGEALSLTFPDCKRQHTRRLLAQHSRVVLPCGLRVNQIPVIRREGKRPLLPLRREGLGGHAVVFYEVREDLPEDLSVVVQFVASEEIATHARWTATTHPRLDHIVAQYHHHRRPC